MKTLIHMKSLKTAILCLPVLLLLTTTAAAQGDLLIFPKRLVFEGTKNRSETLNLSNTGTDTARYDISFVQIRMREDGGFENITEPDPGQLFADPYLRYFPRQVVLAPNESQTVRVQLSRTHELEAGEYRSHLYLRSVSNVKPLGEESNAETAATSVSIRLTPVFGITIPCIIKVGEPTTQVSITNLALEDADHKPSLSMDLNRRGNMSVFGDITVIHTSHQGKKTEVGKVKGLAVYAPGNLRRTRIALEKANGIDYRNGSLQVVYTTADKGLKKATHAEASLVLF